MQIVRERLHIEHLKHLWLGMQSSLGLLDFRNSEILFSRKMLTTSGRISLSLVLHYAVSSLIFLTFDGNSAEPFEQLGAISVVDLNKKNLARVVMTKILFTVGVLTLQISWTLCLCRPWRFDLATPLGHLAGSELLHAS